MKTKKGMARIAGVMMIIIASGCGIADLHPTAAQPDVTPFTYTPSRISTVTQTPPFPPTYIYQSPTPTLNPSPTMPFIPTLPAITAERRLLDLLANNGNCRLPCLLGITPGISTLTEASEILVPLLGYADEHSAIDGGIGNFYFNYKGVRISFVTNPNTNLLSKVSLELTSLSRKPYYSLTNILSEYGKPGSVSLETVPLPHPLYGDTHYLNLLMLYPDQGLAINYTTTTRLSGQNIIGCFSNAALDMDAFPSGHGDTFYQLLPDGYSVVAMSDYRPLEDVTTMTLEDFYQIYSKESDQCLVTANEKWPLIH